MLGISPLRLWIYGGLFLAFIAFCGTIYVKGYLSCTGNAKIEKAERIIEDEKLAKEVITATDAELDRRYSRWLRD